MTSHGPWMIALSQFASHLLVHQNVALSAGMSITDKVVAPIGKIHGLG